MFSIKKQYGVTLTEWLLVLAIGASLIVFGVRQYQLYRVDTDTQLLLFNIDSLFQGLSMYYRQQCYGQTDPSTGVLAPGLLNPSVNPPDPYPVTVQTLIDAGFLSANMPVSPLVAEVSLSGFVIQFNRYTQDRLVCKEAASNASALNPYNSNECTSTAKIGTTVIWKPQVAVRLYITEKSAAFRDILAANCISDLSGNTVTKCASTTGTGNYIVFERLPSAPTTYGTGYELNNQTMQQFNQMYTTYPINYSIGSGGQTPTPDTQYFLCGG